MIDLFGPEGRAALARFVRRRPLFAFDFDGTLAPIVERPGDAALPERTRAMLAELAARHPVVVLTGRGRDDALARLQGLPLAEIVGSHGLETAAPQDPAIAARVRAWRRVLEPVIRGLPGAELEGKALSLALHFRNAPDPSAAEREMRARVAGIPGVRLIGGKFVLNLLPAEGVGKGQALREASRRLGRRHALFAGDDDTDEDVFRLPRDGRLFGIRVGTDATAAEYRIASQRQIDPLLEALLDLL